MLGLNFPKVKGTNVVVCVFTDYLNTAPMGLNLMAMVKIQTTTISKLFIYSLHILILCIYSHTKQINTKIIVC